MDQLDFLGQQLVDAMPDDRVGLPSAQMGPAGVDGEPRGVRTRVRPGEEGTMAWTVTGRGSECLSNVVDGWGEAE